MEPSFGDLVLGALAAQELSLPLSVEHHDSLPSTNDRMKDLGRSGAAEWTTVVTDEQTAGRGRGGHGWASPRGGLYLSVLLRPRWDTTILPLAVGVAVAEALDGWGVGCELKWPNDVMASGAKLGGILMEGAAAADLRWVAVGIGLNVRGRASELSLAAMAPATTLEALGARLPPRPEMVATILGRLARWYDALAAGRREDVRRAWRGWAPSWWGKTIVAEGALGSFVGVARDIDEWGRLVVEREDGVSVSVSAAEVRELRPPCVGSSRGV